VELLAVDLRVEANLLLRLLRLLRLLMLRLLLRLLRLLRLLMLLMLLLPCGKVNLLLMWKHRLQEDRLTRVVSQNSEAIIDGVK
jgi:hypothetical protein